MQQWYGLADEAVEEAIYDSQALRKFMVDLSRQSVPDATTLMGFRHLLEANDLTQAMLVEVNAMLIRHRAGFVDAQRDVGRRHLDRGAKLDEKSGTCAGS